MFAFWPPRTHGIHEFPFAYDHIFQPEVSQADIYHTIAKPIVEGVINGFLIAQMIRSFRRVQQELFFCFQICPFLTPCLHCVYMLDGPVSFLVRHSFYSMCQNEHGTTWPPGELLLYAEHSGCTTDTVWAAYSKNRFAKAHNSRPACATLAGNMLCLAEKDECMRVERDTKLVTERIERHSKSFICKHIITHLQKDRNRPSRTLRFSCMISGLVCRWSLTWPRLQWCHHCVWANWKWQDSHHVTCLQCLHRSKFFGKDSSSRPSCHQ